MRSMQFLSLISLGIVFVFTAISPAESSVYDWDAGALPDVKLKTVRYRIWIPDEVQNVRGVLVLIPGTHGDGRRMISDSMWQDIARKHHFGILGCQFSEGEIAPYQDDKDFVACRSIEKALVKLGEISGHAELSRAPLALWGHSAGSNLSARFCRFAPRRVIAFASCKGTRGPTRDSRGTDEVLMLFAIGERDQPVWVKNSERNVRAGLRRGALWTLALHSSEGHELGGSLKFAATFLEEAFALRLGPLPGKTPVKAVVGPVRLKQLRREEGWLGNPVTRYIAPFSDYPDKIKEAFWLPNEGIARAWKEYLGD